MSDESLSCRSMKSSKFVVTYLIPAYCNPIGGYYDDYKDSINVAILC